jgi:hypothetical protein
VVKQLGAWTVWPIETLKMDDLIQVRGDLASCRVTCWVTQAVTHQNSVLGKQLRLGVVSGAHLLLCSLMYTACTTDLVYCCRSLLFPTTHRSLQISRRVMHAA